MPESVLQTTVGVKVHGERGRGRSLYLVSRYSEHELVIKPGSVSDLKIVITFCHQLQQVGQICRERDDRCIFFVLQSVGGCLPLKTLSVVCTLMVVVQISTNVFPMAHWPRAQRKLSDRTFTSSCSIICKQTPPALNTPSQKPSPGLSGYFLRVFLTTGLMFG